MFPEKLENLFTAVENAKNLLILPHNNPDPDAIASAIGLHFLLREGAGIDAVIGYKGIIGRAENKALTQYLGNPLIRLADASLQTEGRSFAMVDTQPGAGNNALPAQAPLAVIIDHHPWQEATAKGNFIDVRANVGATASILTEYLRLADLEPPPPLATALFYGIKTDTMGLGRGTSSVDTSAICYLLPLIDLKALLTIERAKVPPSYFKSFAQSLQNTRIYDGIIVSYVGSMKYPDMVAEMADFLLRMRGSRWVICMGENKDRLILSVRTQYPQGAGQLVQTVVGKRGIAGGHGSMAGGQVPLQANDDPKALAAELSQKMLQNLGVPADLKGEALV